MSKSDSTHCNFVFLDMSYTSPFYNTIFKNIFNVLWHSYLWLDGIYGGADMLQEHVIIDPWGVFCLLFSL